MTTDLDVVNAGDGLTSLREAVNQANGLAGNNTITFSGSLANKPLLLVGGQLSIFRSVTIQGLGASLTTINGQHGSRLFDISGPGSDSVTLDGLTLKGGTTSANRENGGAIRAAVGQLTIRNSIISGNTTTGDFALGGAIYSTDNVSLSNCTISGNSTSGSGSRGGAIYAAVLSLANCQVSGNSTTRESSAGGALAGISMTLTNSTVAGNSTTDQSSPGGGIFGVSVTISNSSVSGNSTGVSGNGGGINAYASATIINSTVANNSTGYAGYGGGISAGLVTITNSTVSGNVASVSSGGVLAGRVTVDHGTITGNSVLGISGMQPQGGGMSAEFMTIRNSIVAGNLVPANGSNADLQLGNNNTPSVTFSLIGDNDGSGLDPAPIGSPDAQGNFIGEHAVPIDPRLYPLRNNGGPTATHALRVDSPAVDAGDPDFAAPPKADQRGTFFPRVSDGPHPSAIPRVDMGAFELRLPSLLKVDSSSDEDDGDYRAGDLSLREAIDIANNLTGSDTITFAGALAGHPIQLALGQMRISDGLTVQGLSARKTTVDGQNGSRLFDIDSAAGAVTFTGLTLTGGRTTGDTEEGGAIRSASAAALTLRNAAVTGNSTTGTASRGGGISAPNVVLTGATIAGNSTAGNSADGGGIFAGSSLTVVNSTIAGNSTSGVDAHGGGLRCDGATIVNSTIAGNSVTQANGGGIASGLGQITIHNSIVAGNLDSQDGSHPDLRPLSAPELEFSLIGDNNGTSLAAAPFGSPDANGNLIGTHAARIFPQLGPLQNNGGPTKTRALFANSPAKNSGSNVLAVDPTTANLIANDQRGIGFQRVLGAHVDMGAVELQPPRVVLSGTVTYIENAAAVVLASGATVTDADSITFKGGNLTVRITAHAQVNDRLGIKHTGDATGQVGISGTNVTFGGKIIGTFSGGAGTTPLVIKFTTSAATADAAQTLARSITFRSLSENPGATARSVTLTVDDGDGSISEPGTAIKTIKVIPINDAPVLSVGGTVGYGHDAAAIVLVPTATVSDVDSASFGNGRLRVRITDGASMSNRLTIGFGFSVDANNNVLQGTTNIGKRVVNGFGTNELVITFNTNASQAVVQQLVRAITFKTVGGTAIQRKVVFTVSDGDGGLSNEATKTVNVT